jgi:thiol-activated cytolysin
LKTKTLACLILISVLFPFCKKREQKDQDKIDAMVNEAGKYPTPPQNSENYSNYSIDSVLQGSSYVRCTTQNVSVVKRIEDYQIFYSQDYAEIYPGNIVQGKYLKDGRLSSIGEFKRQSISILLQNSTRAKSVEVTDPNRANLTDGVKNNDYYFYFDPPLYTYVNSVRAYSKQQVTLSFGINANWLAASIGGKFDITNEVGKSTVFIQLKQIYYTASVGYPDKPSKFFDKKVDAKDLKNVFTSDNPPAYINSVSYGRIAIAKVSSAYTKDEMILALNAKFNNVGGSLTYQQSQILSTCEYEVVAAGGPQLDTWDINKLSNYFTEGNTFTNRTGAVPIAYTANYLLDNSPFITHTVTEYTKRDCF